MLGHLACTEASPPQVLPLRVHTFATCDLPPELGKGSLELQALGDFAASNDSAEILRLERRGALLPFPVATQAAVARVSDGRSTFAGYGERRENGLDLLLWPELATCEVWRPDGINGYPGRHGGQALAYSTLSGFVVAAGGDDPLVSDAIIGALSLDVGSGTLQARDTSEDGVLRQPRAFATATPFGERFLIAGGEEPVFGVPEADIEPVGTAELFDPRLGRFSGEPLPLRNKRTHHAAVTLEDGRTLLVGGRSKVGATNIAQYQLEIVDPSNGRASVADAIAPRIDPRALRLSDGRIFIGSGVGLDGALTEPVAEWLTAEARPDVTKVSQDVAPRFARAFVATAGGGVLVVGGCEDRPAASEQDAQACVARCGNGCPPLGGEYDAWWLDHDGLASPVSLEGISAPRPILLPGSDGRPWLVAASVATPDIPQLFRFDPWTQRFQPAPTPASLQLPKPELPAPVTLDPDTFVWMDDDGSTGRLMGMRLGTRNRFTQDLALVLLSDPIETRPQHLVPERPPGAAATYDGQLTLSGAALRAERDPPNYEPDVTIRVADTDYGDVTLKLRLARGEPPLVLLGVVTLGGADCPWPEGTKRGGDFELPSVIRQGNRAQLRYHGGARACRVESGRLTLGVRAGDGESVIQELDVLRGAELR